MALALQPELLCSEAELLPRSPAYAVALLDDDALNFCAGEAPALSVSAPSGAFCRRVAIACVGSHRQHAVAALYDIGRAAAALCRDRRRARTAGRSERLQLLGSGPLPWLAAQLPTAAPVNLLQGSHTRRAETSARTGNAGAPVAALAAGCCCSMSARRLVAVTTEPR
jgi:hypothetical protein